MVHAEEEEMSKDKQRKSRLPGYTADDDPVLSEPKSWKEKAACHQGQFPRASQVKAQMQRDGHERIVEEQF